MRDINDCIKPKWIRLNSNVKVNICHKQGKGINVTIICDAIELQYERLVETYYMNTLRLARPDWINRDLHKLSEKINGMIQSYPKAWDYDQLLIYNSDIKLKLIQYVKRFKSYNEKNIDKIIKSFEKRFEIDYRLDKWIARYYIRHQIDFYDFISLNDRRELPIDFPDMKDFVRYLSLWKFSHFLDSILIISDIINTKP